MILNYFERFCCYDEQLIKYFLLFTEFLPNQCFFNADKETST